MLKKINTYRKLSRKIYLNKIKFKNLIQLITV